MPPGVASLTDKERWVVRCALDERWPGGSIETDDVSVEIRLHESDRDLSICPALFWEFGGCRFILVKTGEQRYRCQFFYRGNDRFGTDIEEFDNIGDCVVGLLQAQADRAGESRGEQPA